MAPETDATCINVYTFTKETPADAWSVQNDTVMGGVSNSEFRIDDEGHGLFTGHVSLENNGGFASVQHKLDEPVDVSAAASFQLRVRGDGKDYTFRVKSERDQKHSYQFTFPTKVSEAWETIGIPFAAMEAYYRGDKVDVPNFPGNQVTKIQFLIGNGKEQDFEIRLAAFEAV